MNNYIIDVIYAINIICNLVAFFLLFSLYEKYSKNLYIKTSLKIIFTISILGLLFLPSKEVLIELIK